MSGFAQFTQSGLEIAPSFDPTAEAAPGLTPAYPGQSALTPALWDIQFSYSVADTLGAGALAGAIWTGTEFWISRWNADSLFTLDMNGSVTSRFVVPGLTGVRSLTWDGTNIYAGTAATTVAIVNPVTKTLTGTITTPVIARHCTYDSTLNSGAGGLWVGNWNTDIVAVAMNGSTLATIPASTHGLAGMYGSAFDNQTAGGPYLWIFNQGGANNSDIVRLQLPGGTPTIVVHDVMSDIGLGSTSGLAGGLFITDGLVANKWTLGGLIQSQPSNILFGYELNDFIQPAVDAQLTTARHTSGFTQIPLNHAGNVAFEGNITNKGSDPLTTFGLVTQIWSGATLIASDTATGSNLAPNASTTLTSAGFNFLSKGSFDVILYADVMGTQSDTVNFNDTTYYGLTITDSTFSRDNGIPTGTGYTISATSNGYAVTTFTLSVDDTLSSITIGLQTPTPGDTTYGVVTSLSSGFPFQVLALGKVYVITGATNDMVLRFPGGVALPAGEYAFGCYEGVNTGIGLAQSNSVYTPGSNFFYTPANGWSQSNIQTSRWIHPNFGSDFGVSVDPDHDLSGNVTFYPNPTEGTLNLMFSLEDPARADITVANLQGKVMMNVNNKYVHKGTTQMDLSQLPAGMYLVKVQTEQGAVTQRINVMK